MFEFARRFYLSVHVNKQRKALFSQTGHRRLRVVWCQVLFILLLRFVSLYMTVCYRFRHPAGKNCCNLMQVRNCTVIIL